MKFTTSADGTKIAFERRRSGRQIIPEAEADAWLREFDTLEQQGAYFFCSMPILTEAVKVVPS